MLATSKIWIGYLQPGLPRYRLAAARRTAADGVLQQLVGAYERERRPRGNHSRRRCWLGHGNVGAARLATLPTTSSVPLRSPAHESASNVLEAATMMPSTDSGVSAATHSAAHAALPAPSASAPQSFKIPGPIRR
jgi:hypothetical protein